MTDAEVREVFASRLVSWMNDNGVSQYRLSKKMGVPWQTVHSWKVGRSMPGFCRIRELAMVTGEPADWWLGLDWEVDGGRDGR